MYIYIPPCILWKACVVKGQKTVKTKGERDEEKPRLEPRQQMWVRSRRWGLAHRYTSSQCFQPELPTFLPFLTRFLYAGVRERERERERGRHYVFFDFLTERQRYRKKFSLFDDSANGCSLEEKVEFY